MTSLNNIDWCSPFTYKSPTAELVSCSSEAVIIGNFVSILFERIFIS